MEVAMPLEVGTVSTTAEELTGDYSNGRNALRSRDSFNDAKPAAIAHERCVGRNALRSRDSFNLLENIKNKGYPSKRRNALRSRDSFNSSSLVLEYQPIHFPKSPISDRHTLKIA